MIELLNLWQLQSANVAAEQNVNSLSFIYLVLSIIINRPALLLAYISSEMLYQLSIFDFLFEWQLFAIECIIYSYVFMTLESIKSKCACAILISSTLYFIYDAHKYGVSEGYAGYETILYAYIKYIFTCAHIIFICSFISIGRIRDGLRDSISFISRISLNSDYMCIYRYNVSKAIK